MRLVVVMVTVSIVAMVMVPNGWSSGKALSRGMLIGISGKFLGVIYTLFIFSFLIRLCFLKQILFLKTNLPPWLQQAICF